MVAVVCVDDRYGMRFAGRRQSRDSVLCEDMVRLCGRIRMKAASAPLFSEWPEAVVLCEALRDENGFCFVEDDDLQGAAPEGMILYRWNRRYPADLHLRCLPEEQGMTLFSREEFAGSSHERITREIWRKTDEKG